MTDQSLNILIAFGLLFGGLGITFAIVEFRGALKILRMQRVHLMKPIDKPTCSMSDLYLWSIDNWKRLPAAMRKQCIDHLDKVMRKYDDGERTLKLWKRQKLDGMRIGSNEQYFDLCSGMHVRNILREMFKDNELPPVRHNGELERDWENYFYGALDELAGRPS